MNKHSQNRMILLVSIMAAIVIIVTSITISLLYNRHFEETRIHLVETTHAQVQLIEAVAKFDAIHSKHDIQGGSAAATLSQIRDAFQTQSNPNHSFEMVVAQKHNGKILFLITYSGKHPVSLPLQGSEQAEPMRRALLGQTGTMVGLDFLNHEVLAAYKPIKSLNLGLVSKIDLDVIREPFIKAGLIATGIALILILIGAFLFHIIGNPILRRLEKAEQKSRSLNSGLEHRIKERTSELEAAMSELKKVQENYLQAEKVANIGHWELDLIHHELTWSEQNYRIFGVPLDTKNTYETFLERIHPDDIDYVNKSYAHSLENKTVYNIEHRLLMEDGEIKWIQELCETYYDESGTALRSLGTTMDITERKMAEIAVKVSELKFSSIVEQAPGAIISIDEKQNITLFNSAAESTFGYSREEALGKHVNILIPERFQQDHPSKVDKFRDAISSKIVRKDKEMYGLRKNGEEFEIETSISKLTLNDKVIMTIILHDISSRLQAEAQLRKLSQAIQQAGEAVVITNKAGIIEYINPAFTATTGYNTEDAIGKTPAILKSSAQNPAVYQELWATITKGEIWHGSMVDRKKDGSFYPVLMTISPILNEEGVITHYVSLQQDMSEHQHLEEQLLQAQKMEAIGTLVGGIAHDFNNMLAGIMGNVYLAKRKAGQNEDVLKKLESVESLSNRAAEMIKQLLTFARKDSVKMRTFTITPFFKEAIKLAESAIPESINFTHNISNQEILIRGDSTQLQQVLMNLLNNARDAVENVSQPTIHSQLELFTADASFKERHPELKADTFAHLLVSDNGLGIPSEKQERIFEPFYTTKGVGKGTGLGLSMVFGAVKRHNGVVELKSEAGKGTTFHIYLPSETEKSEEVSLKTDKILQGKGETILLVDDEESMLSTISEALRDLDYKVLEAVNGEEALKIYQANAKEVDLLFTDLVMPVMGGLELAKAIRTHNRELPIIFATGYDKDQASDGDIHIDNSLILSKPFAFSELSQLIRILVDEK